MRAADPTFAGSTSGSLDEADIVVWGAPTDAGAGTHRTGAAGGPAAIRAASNIWHSVRTSAGYSLGEHGRILDLGDVELDGLPVEEAHARIRAEAPELVENRLSVALGGDHSITFPILQKSNAPCALIMMDAHPDCLDRCNGSRLSHACTLQRLVESKGIDPQRTVVFGLRLPEAEEAAFLERQGIRALTSRAILEMGIGPACEQALELAGGEKPYLSIDMDVLDASCAPGVENPEPGGISSADLLYACDFFGAHICACDLTEVTDQHDPAGITAKTAARALLDLMGAHVRESAKG